MDVDAPVAAAALVDAPSELVLSKIESSPVRIGSPRGMSLELILGPMFAGKSSYLLSTIRRYEAIGFPILVLTSDIDTRYTTNAICNHNKESHPAMATKELCTVTDTVGYLTSRLVVIEESQFFSDLLPFVLQAVEKDKKDVIVVGLDGDSQRRPFGDILKLIPYCDKVSKVTALCKRCGNGTEALFTYRTTSETSVVSVGAADRYEALCRKHFLEMTRPPSQTPDVNAFEHKGC